MQTFLFAKIGRVKKMKKLLDGEKRAIKLLKKIGWSLAADKKHANKTDLHFTAEGTALFDDKSARFSNTARIPRQR